MKLSEQNAQYIDSLEERIHKLEQENRKQNGIIKDMFQMQKDVIQTLTTLTIMEAMREHEKEMKRFEEMERDYNIQAEMEELTELEREQ